VFLLLIGTVLLLAIWFYQNIIFCNRTDEQESLSPYYPGQAFSVWFW